MTDDQDWSEFYMPGAGGRCWHGHLPQHCPVCVSWMLMRDLARVRAMLRELLDEVRGR